MQCFLNCCGASQVFKDSQSLFFNKMICVNFSKTPRDSSEAFQHRLFASEQTAKGMHISQDTSRWPWRRSISWSSAEGKIGCNKMHKVLQQRLFEITQSYQRMFWYHSLPVAMTCVGTVQGTGVLGVQVMCSIVLYDSTIVRWRAHFQIYPFAHLSWHLRGVSWTHGDGHPMSYHTWQARHVAVLRYMAFTASGSSAFRTRK